MKDPTPAFADARRGGRARWTVVAALVSIAWLAACGSDTDPADPTGTSAPSSGAAPGDEQRRMEDIAEERWAEGRSADSLVVVRRGADGPEVETIALDPDGDNAPLIDDLRGDDDVLGVSVNWPLRPLTGDADDDGGGEAWHVDASGVDADSLAPGNEQTGLVIGVVDDGDIDDRAPPLEGRVLPGLDVINGGEPEVGWHATAVGRMAVDTYPRSRLLPAAHSTPEVRGTAAEAATAIIWAVDQGARIINLSFGVEPDCVNLLFTGIELSCPDPSALQAAISHATAAGAIVLSAGSNDPACPEMWPTGFDGVISVGALDEDGNEFGCAGPGRVDVWAPGVDIPVPDPDGDGMIVASGTSLAAPIVAAQVAALWDQHPWLTADDVRQALFDASIDGEVLTFGSLVAALGPLPPARVVVEIESMIARQGHELSRNGPAEEFALLAGRPEPIVLTRDPTTGGLVGEGRIGTGGLAAVSDDNCTPPSRTWIWSDVRATIRPEGDGYAFFLTVEDERRVDVYEEGCVPAEDLPLERHPDGQEQVHDWLVANSPLGPVPLDLEAGNGTEAVEIEPLLSWEVRWRAA